MVHTSLVGLPKLVAEKLVKQFYFVAENNIQVGMTFEQRLYKLHQSFQTQTRSHAMSMAAALAHQGVNALITVSDQGRLYRVWIDLRSADHPALLAGNELG